MFKDKWSKQDKELIEKYADNLIAEEIQRYNNKLTKADFKQSFISKPYPHVQLICINKMNGLFAVDILITTTGKVETSYNISNNSR